MALSWKLLGITGINSMDVNYICYLSLLRCGCSIVTWLDSFIWSLKRGFIIFVWLFILKWELISKYVVVLERYFVFVDDSSTFLHWCIYFKPDIYEIGIIASLFTTSCPGVVTLVVWNIEQTSKAFAERITILGLFSST